MPFVPSMPTFNRTVSVYRCIAGQAGNVLRGTIMGQIYAMLKRTSGEEKAQLLFQYPYDTTVILHGPDQLPAVGNDTQYDVITWPWPGSPNESGVGKMFVGCVLPRFESFPNRHNIAILHEIPYSAEQLWF